MPKHNKRVTFNDRLARRSNSNSIDPERSELLARILEEGSSIPLNDGSKQQSPRQALEVHSDLLELIEKLKAFESNLNPKLPCRNRQSVEKFFNWIQSNHPSSGRRLCDEIDIVEYKQKQDVTNDTNEDQQEYALVAKVPFKKSDKIFSVSRKLMLTTETAAKDDDLAEFIRKDSIASGMQNVVLALHLLNEYSKGENSYWYPYLSVLPRKILPVLSLNKQKLANLLPSGHIFEALKMIRAISRQYSYFMKRLQSTQLPLSKDFTYEYYCWGVSMVCSRQNEIPYCNKKSLAKNVIHALIPVLDMCNHNIKSNQAVFEDEESKLTAVQNLDANEEITINYGIRSSGEFFIHNGFVPNYVQHDFVPLTLMLDKENPLFSSKAKLLKTLNMPNFGRFKLTKNDYENRHKKDPHLTMFLIVYLMNEAEINYTNNDDNPVGIADEIYEHVHYNKGNNSNTSGNEREDGGNQDKLDKSKEVLTTGSMKERLALSVKEYLSKRASICMALIDRTLKDESQQISPQLSSLLKHERSIYESYLINSKR